MAVQTGLASQKSENEGLVVNIKAKRQYEIYVGRGSDWGNPFSHKQGTQARFVVATRADAIERYREHLWRRIRDEGAPLVHRLAQLNGKVLGCYCKPAACHGDVLVVAARWAARENERAVLDEIERVFGATGS